MVVVVVIIISSSITFDDERNAFLINIFLGVRRKERNILFNEALNTFYLGLYGVRQQKRKSAATTWATLSE